MWRPSPTKLGGDPDFDNPYAGTVSDGNCLRRIRVLSLIHNAFLREGMRIFIETEPALALVASVSHADAALRAFDVRRPDLILVDLDLKRLRLDSGAETGLPRLARPSEHQTSTGPGFSGFTAAQPAIEATRQSLWSAATRTLMCPSWRRSTAMASCKASRVRRPSATPY